MRTDAPVNQGSDAPIFPRLPATLGVYRLSHLLGSHPYSDFYVARQSHVERRVVLEVLRAAGTGGEETELFLSHARARVAATLPHVSQVLESSTSPDGLCYICQNLPEGHTLASMAAEGKQLGVLQICDIVLKAAELYQACAAAGLAAVPFTADMVFTTRNGKLSFLSPVLSTPPQEDDTTRQIQALAAILEPLRPVDVPGQGRIVTLLSWMAEGYDGQPLDWEAISGTASVISEQMQPDSRLHVTRPLSYDRGREERAAMRRRKRAMRRNLLITGALLAVMAVGATGFLFAPDTPDALPPVRGKYAYCKVNNETVRVLARPVSIGEYARFLSEYPNLDAGRRGSITTNIPPAQSDPEPEDWQAMFSAAQQGGEWKGQKLSESSPVTNVSYWQALMYARYMRGKLPTAPLLHAVREAAGQPGIEEWTLDTRPATPPYTQSHVVLPAEAGHSPIPENNPDAFGSRRGFRYCP